MYKNVAFAHDICLPGCGPYVGSRASSNHFIVVSFSRFSLESHRNLGCSTVLMFNVGFVIVWKKPRNGAMLCIYYLKCRRLKVKGLNGIAVYGYRGTQFDGPICLAQGIVPFRSQIMANVSRFQLLSS